MKPTTKGAIHMTDLAEVVDGYLAGWNEGDPERRDQLIRMVWAEDGRLIDPPLAATGQDEISKMAATLQSQFPDHRFQRSSALDEHHNYFRFSWDLVAEDGSVALTGLDVGEVSDEGAIVRITGFFGDLTPSDPT
jgi:hypothetical protein